MAQSRLGSSEAEKVTAWIGPGAKTMAVIVGGLTIFVFLAWLMTLGERSKLTPEERELQTKIAQMRAACRSAIESRLHDRGSVEWVDSQVTADGGYFTVAIDLRAKNAFNAYRLGTFTCTFSKLSAEPLTVAQTK